MNRFLTRRNSIAATLLVALLVWLLWPSNQMARVEALQKELANENLSQEERQQIVDQLRAARSKLSSAEREKLGNQRMQQQMAKYFAMTPAEKAKHLDEQINRSEQMRQQFANSGPGGPPAGGPPGGGGPKGSGKSSSADDKEKRRQQRLNGTSPEFRGQMDQYRKDMEARRQQRGLPATSRGGR